MKSVFNKPFLLLSISAILIFSSCRKDKWPCINGHGPSVTQMRTIDGISGISIETDASVYITQGDTYSCTINAQQNIADNILFRQNGGRLTIYNNRCVRNYSPVIINITLPVLNYVDISGSGSVNTSGKFSTQYFETNISGSGNLSVNDSIIAQDFTSKISGSGDMYILGAFSNSSVKISGSGSIILSGKSNYNNITISGSGKVRAFSLLTNTTTVNTSGSGDSDVNVTNTLDVTISGSGNVRYKGYPAVTAHISGSGDVINAN